MKKVSIQDIAVELGLSKGTVSLVLNGKAKESRISDATRRRVLNLANDLGYQPNEIARSLSTGKTKCIGVVVTDISNEFYGYLTLYIQLQAKKYGYSVMVANSNENLDDFGKSIVTFLNKQTDGIILVAVDGGELFAKKILDRHVPMVQIDRYYPEVQSSYVIVDNYWASYKAVESLINRGCKRIAYINYAIAQKTLQDRARGCIDALKRYRLLDDDLIKTIDFIDQEKYLSQAFYDLKHYREKVDAIFFCSRRAFISGLKYIYEMDIKVPDDLLLLCFDKMDFFPLINMPINYIEQPIKEMAEKAVDILVQQIDVPNSEQHVILKTKLCNQ